jgi:hypothetical protein
MVDQSVTMERLDDQIAWYGDKGGRCKRRYIAAKLVQLGVSATIPLAALSDLAAQGPAISAVLGAVLVAVEGVLQLTRYHENWLTYRATAEALKHEKFLFLAAAGPYAGDNRLPLLAERVESLVSQENSSWVATQQTRSDGQKAPA